MLKLNKKDTSNINRAIFTFQYLFNYQNNFYMTQTAKHSAAQRVYHQAPCIMTRRY